MCTGSDSMEVILLVLWALCFKKWPELCQYIHIQHAPLQQNRYQLHVKIILLFNSLMLLRRPNYNLWDLNLCFYAPNKKKIRGCAASSFCCALLRLPITFPIYSRQLNSHQTLDRDVFLHWVTESTNTAALCSSLQSSCAVSIVCTLPAPSGRGFCCGRLFYELVKLLYTTRVP